MHPRPWYLDSGLVDWAFTDRAWTARAALHLRARLWMGFCRHLDCELQDVHVYVLSAFALVGAIRGFGKWLVRLGSYLFLLVVLRFVLVDGSVCSVVPRDAPSRGSSGAGLDGWSHHQAHAWRAARPGVGCMVLSICHWAFLWRRWWPARAALSRPTVEHWLELLGWSYTPCTRGSWCACGGWCFWLWLVGTLLALPACTVLALGSSIRGPLGQRVDRRGWMTPLLSCFAAGFRAACLANLRPQLVGSLGLWPRRVLAHESICAVVLEVPCWLLE